MVKERYRDYLYIEVMPEESKNAAFYQRHGFSIMPDGVAMQICNPGERRYVACGVWDGAFSLRWS